MTGLEFSKALKYGPYAWPGGYPLFLVMTDGSCFCYACAKEEAVQIRHAAMTKAHDGWRPACFDVNWESALTCDNCGEDIESAYPTAEED